MIVRLALIGAAAALAACTASQVATTLATADQVAKTLATADQVITDGQLVCQTGQTYSAMYDALTGKPILAKGAAATAVNAVCGLVQGVATALPSAAVQPAGLVVQLPPTLTIPLKQ